MHVAPSNRAFARFTLCLWFSLAPARAWAHGNERPANVTALAVPSATAGGPQAPWLAGLTFGAALSFDAGKTYLWVCEQALAGPTNNDVTVAVAHADALLYVEEDTGLRISRDGGCSWPLQPEFAAPKHVTGLRLHPTQSSTWLVLGQQEGDTHGSIWRTEDDGKTYAALNFAAPGVFLTDIAYAGDDSNTLIATGSNNTSENSAQLWVSHDGGASFAGGSIVGAPPAVGTAKLALHPQDPQQMLVALLDITNNATQVLKSQDGGGKWQRVLLVREPVRSMVYVGSGEQVLVAGTLQTFRSADAGSSFALLTQPSFNACATSLEGASWICGGKSQGDPYSLGHSPRPGAPFAASFSMSNLRGPYHCPAGTEVYDRCMPQWPQQAQQLGARVPAPSQAALDGHKGGGCSHGDAHPQQLLLPLAALALFGLRRRQKA